MSTTVSQSRGNLVCFLPAQESDGASTVALHVARALSLERGMSTLLADLDYHSGTVAQRLGMEPAGTLGDVSAEEPGAWSKVVAAREDFNVLAAPVSSGQLTTKGLPPIVDVLRGACGEYDYVVADLPSALSSSAREILSMAWRLCIVFTPDFTSLHLARRRIRELGELTDDERLLCVLNRSGSSPVLNDDDVRTVLEREDLWLLANDYPTVHKAERRGDFIASDTELGTQLYGLAWRLDGLSRPPDAESSLLRRLLS